MLNITFENGYSFSGKRPSHMRATLIFHFQPGRYTFLNDIKTLRSVMATYYNLFALGKQLSPVVSVPYIDAFGTGTLHRLFTDLCKALDWSI